MFSNQRRNTLPEGGVNQRGSYSQAEVVLIGFGISAETFHFIKNFFNVLRVCCTFAKHGNVNLNY
jgi:hypothetical protein